MYAKYTDHVLGKPQILVSSLGPVYETSCAFAGYSLGVTYVSTDNGESGAKIVFFDGATSTAPAALTQDTSVEGDGMVDNDIQASRGEREGGGGSERLRKGTS